MLDLVVLKLVKRLLNCHVKSKHQSSQGKKTEAFEWNYEGLRQAMLIVLVGNQPTKWSLKQTQLFLCSNTP